MAYCEKHRRQHLDAGCSKCWEGQAAGVKERRASMLANIAPELANKTESGLANAADGPHRHYRDKDKRRAYMREFMRRKRAG